MSVGRRRGRRGRLSCVAVVTYLRCGEGRGRGLRERGLDCGGDRGRVEEGLDFLEHAVLKGGQSSLDLVVHVLRNLSLHGLHRHLGTAVVIGRVIGCSIHVIWSYGRYVLGDTKSANGIIGSTSGKIYDVLLSRSGMRRRGLWV